MRREWEGDSSSAHDKLVSNEFINEWMAALIASNRNRSHFTEELICGRMLLWLYFSLTWLDLLCFTLFCVFLSSTQDNISKLPRADMEILQFFFRFSFQPSSSSNSSARLTHFDSSITHMNGSGELQVALRVNQIKSHRVELDRDPMEALLEWKILQNIFFIVVVVVALCLPPCLIWKSRERWTAASTSETRFSISFQRIGDTHKALSCRVCVVCSRHRAHKQWRY